MSIEIYPAALVTVSETELECPICTAKFDAGDKMDKAKYPDFKTKCPACKGDIGIRIPIFGGVTKCYEWNDSKNCPRVTTEAKFTVNGIKITDK